MNYSAKIDPGISAIVSVLGLINNTGPLVNRERLTLKTTLRRECATLRQLRVDIRLAGNKLTGPAPDL